MKSFVKDKFIVCIFLFFVLLFFIFFYIKLHPIVISDTDDWWYTYYHREAIPLWGNWNPSRVFAEVFMPFVSFIAGYIVYPLSDNYFSSFTFCYAFSVAIAITFLSYSLVTFLCSANGSQTKSSLLLCIYFLVSHFWCFRIHETQNDYMLRSINACTFFYYLIPDLLNAALVLLLAKHKCQKSEISITQLSFFFILVYFCIFSNIWASVIVASYIGAELCFDLAEDIIGRRFSLKNYLKTHTYGFLIIGGWIIAQIFELYGGRASSIADIDFISGIKESINTLYFELTQVNRPFLISACIFFVFGLIISIRSSETRLLKSIFTFLLAAIFNVAYLIVSGAKTSPGYLYRTDVFYGAFFFLMIVLVLSLYSLFISIPKIQILIPMFLLIAVINCNTENKTYLESNVYQLAPEIWNRVNNDIMAQFVQADQNGETQLVLYIPQFQEADNFPLALYSITRFSDHFYKMGVTENKIQVTELVPTISKNAELFVPVV